MTDTIPNRQQAGAPNSVGGQFRETTKTETSAVLHDETDAQRAVRLADEDLHRAFTRADAFEHRARQTALRALDLDVQARFPDAAEVHFVRHYSNDETDWDVVSILDKDGNELDGTPHFHDREAIRTRLAVFGDSTTAYLDEETSHHGDGAVLQVGSTDANTIDAISHTDAAQLLGPVHDALQTVGGSWDIDEVSYVLFEDPKSGGFDDGEGDALITRYGTRKAALEAIGNTRSYLDLDESLYRASKELFIPAIQDAVNETLK